MVKWSATIKRNSDGELLLRFLRPTSELSLTPGAARRLAASLLLAAEGTVPTTIRSDGESEEEEHDG